MLTILWQSFSDVGTTIAPGVFKSISDHRFKRSWNVGSFGSVKIAELGDKISFSEGIFEVIDMIYDSLRSRASKYSYLLSTNLLCIETSHGKGALLCL
jgi:hypothetical protein